MAPEEGAIHLIKLNNVDPHAYLTETITLIVNGHLNSRLDEFIPWAHQSHTVT